MPDVIMPRLSDTMEEGILSRWVKHEGDPVGKGDVLAEIETDKAVMELEAYDAGGLTEVLVPEGTTVPIGTPIAAIGTAADAQPPARSGGPAVPPGPLRPPLCRDRPRGRPPAAGPACRPRRVPAPRRRRHTNVRP